MTRIEALPLPEAPLLWYPYLQSASAVLRACGCQPEVCLTNEVGFS